jgi:lipopolysaccharide export system permease protein
MIKKYILKELLKTFILLLLALIILSMIIQFFSNVNIIFKSGVSFLIILKYFILKTPELLYFLFPMAVLGSSLYMFGTLKHNYEIVSIRTLNIPKSEIFKTLIIAGLIFYALQFFNNEFINPKSYYFAKIIKNTIIKKKDNYAIFKANKIWYKKNNYIFKIDIADFQRKFMRGITILKIDKNFHIKRRIEAFQGFYQNSCWELYNVEIYNFRNGTLKHYKKTDKYRLPEKLEREDFVVITAENQNLSFLELIKIIQKLKGSKIDTRKYKVDLINKFIFPLVNILFLFISFLANIGNPREKSGFINILLSLIFGFSFFLLHNFFISLSYAKIIPYFIAPFLSFILAGIIIFKLNKKVKY